MPKGTKPQIDPDAELYKGRPEDGQEYTETPTPESGEDLEEEQKSEDKAPEPSPKDKEDPLVALQRTVDSLQATINNMNRPTPPKAPDPEPEPDWEDLMFKDPKEYHRLLRQSIEKSVKGELTNSYQQAEGEKDFWRDFYKSNDDLKDDDFLVKAVLKENLQLLAPMVVPDAAKRLAELTRERIMRYTGNKLPSTTKKAVTEGSNPPSPVKKEPEPDKVVTLSDLIKARRAKRNKGTAA